MPGFEWLELDRIKYVRNCAFKDTGPLESVVHSSVFTFLVLFIHSTI